MEAVYRETLRGPALRSPTLHSPGLRDPAPRPPRSWNQSLAFRRLGFSLVVTALLLALSLLIPRAAYPSLIGPSRFRITEQSSGIVRNTFDDAQRAVQGILRESVDAGSKNGGRLR